MAPPGAPDFMGSNALEVLQVPVSPSSLPSLLRPPSWMGGQIGATEEEGHASVERFTTTSLGYSPSTLYDPR